MDSSSTENQSQYYLKHCDQRLSRAAREIVRQKLIQITRIKDKDTSLWNLLDQYARQEDGHSCPLLLDAFKVQDIASVKIPATVPLNHLGVPKPYVPPGQLYRHRNSHWYQCTICQKIFISQQYLDQHMINHHSTSLTGLCPADDWCRFLSLQACYEMAQTLEPQRYNSPIPSCDDSSMELARQECYNVMRACFHPDIGVLLQKSLCQTLSCPTRLQQLIAQTITTQQLRLHVHEWQDEWTYWYTQHHEVGWMGLFVLTGLGFFYLWNWRPANINRHNTTRLLRKTPLIKRKQQ